MKFFFTPLLFIILSLSSLAQAKITTLKSVSDFETSTCLALLFNKGELTGACSGLFISPTKFAIAAHCVLPDTGMNPPLALCNGTSYPLSLKSATSETAPYIAAGGATSDKKSLASIFYDAILMDSLIPYSGPIAAIPHSISHLNELVYRDECWQVGSRNVLNQILRSRTSILNSQGRLSYKPRAQAFRVRFLPPPVHGMIANGVYDTRLPRLDFLLAESSSNTHRASITEGDSGGPTVCKDTRGQAFLVGVNSSILMNEYNLTLATHSAPLYGNYDLVKLNASIQKQLSRLQTKP